MPALKIQFLTRNIVAHTIFYIAAMAQKKSLRFTQIKTFANVKEYPHQYAGTMAVILSK